MTMTVDTNTPPKDLIGFLEYYLVQKAPFQIPDGGREIIVKFGPWITVVLLVLMLPPLLLVLGIGTVLMPFGGIGYATGFGLSAIGLVATIALMVMALPGLFARKMTGWTMMFYAQIASIVTSLVTGSIFAAIFGGLIGLYVLFQVRGLYR